MCGGASGRGEPAAPAGNASRVPQLGGPAFEGPVRHVYVHIPFCRAKCDYCDFASLAVGDPAVDGGDSGVNVVDGAGAAGGANAGGRAAGAGSAGAAGVQAAARFDGFVDGLAAEWERERAAHDVRRLTTLYLGGGTPSLLGPERLERLLELFRPQLTPHAEVTVEANPEDVDDAFAAWAAAAPVAGGAGAGRGLRVSLGVQSFSAERRAALGRRTLSAPDAAVARLRAAGVENLSLDLMYGIPGQTAADLEADLAATLAARPEHVSWYELTVVPGTPLARRVAAVAAAPADACDDARALRRIVKSLTAAGYDWYEVSNYAMPGRKARHNLAYWRARPYLGLGPGAVSTVGARRWTNVAEPDPWAAALAAGRLPPRRHERLTVATRARERLLLAARCGEPVSRAEIAAAVDDGAVAPLAAAGLVSLHSGTIRVTRKGRHVANEVCVRLFRSPRLRE